LNLSTGGVLTSSGSGGTVTSASVVTANGVSGTVATATTTPAITLTLGAITPTSVTASGSVTGTSIIKSGGTAVQFLKADGSVDATSYSVVREVADEFTATAAQTAFTLTQTPSVNSKVKMFINGIRISKNGYSWTNAALTYIPASNGSYVLVAGDRVQFDYYY